MSNKKKQRRMAGMKSKPVPTQPISHKYIKTDTDMEYHLNEQMIFLNNSIRLFDFGYISEAKRLALAIRVLVYDTNSSTSLLKHLGKKDIGFYDTASHSEPHKSYYINLIKLVSTPYGFNCAALCEKSDLKRKIPFDEWWDTNIVFTSLKKQYAGIILDDKTDFDEVMHRFSRKDIVIDMANKDGGAHVDRNLNEAYADFTRDHNLGWANVTDKGIQKMATPIEFAAVQQIAFELYYSIKDEYPSFPNLPLVPKPKGGVSFSNFRYSPVIQH